jgi:hypothetical protein
MILRLAEADTLYLSGYAPKSTANSRSRSQCDRTLAALRSDKAFCFDFAKVMAPE